MEKRFWASMWAGWGLWPAWKKNEMNELDKLVQGTYTIEKRMMLDVWVGQETTPHAVLNDAVLSRGTYSHILDFEVLLNNESICHYPGPMG